MVESQHSKFLPFMEMVGFKNQRLHIELDNFEFEKESLLYFIARFKARCYFTIVEAFEFDREKIY